MTDTSTKVLKWTVISFGLLLLGGLILLISMVYERASRKPPVCEKAHITVPESTRIITADRDLHTITLLMELPEQGQAIWEVDRCSGDVVYKLDIN